MKQLKYLTISFLLLAAVAQADQSTQVELFKERDLLNQSIEQNTLASGHRNIVSAACFSGSLPTTPRSPNYTMNWSSSPMAMNMIFWREPCQNGSGNALLMRATPTSGKPFLCGGGASIIVQNGVQNNNIKLATNSSGSGSWCDYLFVPTTVLVTEYYLTSSTFKVDQAMTFYYDFVSTASLNIPAATTTTTPQANGTANGYKSGTATCKNNATGATVTTPLSSTGTWDCKAKGLVVKSGQSVTTTINGTLK